VGHLVGGHDGNDLGVGIWLDDHESRVPQVADVDHESDLHDVRLEAPSSLQHSADLELDHLKWRFANALPEPDFK
jgi:hypothetical protein